MNEKRRRANALMMKYYSGMIDEGSWKTAAGDIAVFNTKYRRNLNSLVVQLEPIQSGSGDPSPDNIRPISGRTGATVTRTGKNLFDSTQILQASGWTVENNVYSGTRGAFHVAFSDGFPIVPKFKENTRYTLSLTARLDDGSSYARIGFMYTDGTSTSVANITTTAETQYSRVSAAGKTVSGIYGTYGSGPSVTLYLTNIQLEEGTTVTPYAPYTGTTYPVSWETEAGPVYGGALDVVSGKLTVDKVLWTNNTANMNNSENYPGWKNYGIAALVGSGHSQTFTDQLMNIGNVFSVNTLSTNDILYLPRVNYNNMSETEWKALAIDIQIAVELATPQTYQLTPQQIQTLLGDNVIWSDAGPVSVEYWS